MGTCRIIDLCRQIVSQKVGANCFDIVKTRDYIIISILKYAETKVMIHRISFDINLLQDSLLFKASEADKSCMMMFESVLYHTPNLRILEIPLLTSLILSAAHQPYYSSTKL